MSINLCKKQKNKTNVNEAKDGHRMTRAGIIELDSQQLLLVNHI